MTDEPTGGPWALVVGGFGGLGAPVCERLRLDGFQVLPTSRTSRPGGYVLDCADSGADLTDLPLLDAVVWAQGINVNDGATSHASDDFDAVLAANVTAVARTLRLLDVAGRLRDGARLCVLSSVWEQVARPGKFSYTVSKAALGGLVRAAALDLAPRRMLINAVLPGVIDTAMTRSVLSPEQVQNVACRTGHGRLVEPSEVAGVVAFLCSPDNTAVTGQSIVVDLGFSVAHQF